jgi:hypothetical protein
VRKGIGEEFRSYRSSGVAGATGDMEILLEEVSKLLVAYASAIEAKR